METLYFLFIRILKRSNNCLIFFYILFSELLINLFIFDLCLTKINIASKQIPTINHKLNGHNFVSGYVNKFFENSFFPKLIKKADTKIEEVATSDASEMYRLIKNTITKIIIAITNSIGVYPKIAPALVETAFPPLNFK